MDMHRHEQEKLERLYRLYEQKMFRIAYSILNQTEQAEDAVSEVFLKLIYRMDQIREPESEETQRYLLRMIKNEAIDGYRRNQRESRYREAVEAETEPTVDPFKGWADREDFRWKFRAGFQKLPPKYQEVIWLRFVKEQSVAETAGLLGISEALVRKRIERARKLLAKQPQGSSALSSGQNQGISFGYSTSRPGDSQRKEQI